MAITLTQDSVPARTVYYGGETFVLAPGKSLVVETTPQGEEILNVEVPSGKSWAVTVNVHVTETDA